MSNKDYVLSIFKKWHDKELSDSELINELNQFNSNFDDSDIWFRFFKHDTLATTINDIEKDLADNNRDYIIEQIETALENPEDFQLNYDYYEQLW